MRGLLYCYYDNTKTAAKISRIFCRINRDINYEYIVAGGCHEKRQYF